MSEMSEIRARAIEIIQEALETNKRDRERLEHLLKVYTSGLYQGFDEAVSLLHETTGLTAIQKPRRLAHPAGGWRSIMQIPINDWYIVIVPLVGSAWPNMNDEAMIPGSAFKEPCARIAFFLMQMDNPQATAFYDVIILLNSSWFAWGYGWPKQRDDVESTNFTTLALDMLSSFAKDIHLSWEPRAKTTLADASSAKRRAYEFGLPGDE